MALNSLALARVYQMSKATETVLTTQHLDVLEYAWRFYRDHSVGPLYQNIRRHTGVGKVELGKIFPHGLNSVFSWIGIPIQGKESGCKAMVALDVENPREVYLDHNATTPIRQEVSRAMVDFLEDPRSFGNASSAYDIGSVAFDVVDQARRRVAAILGVSPAEICFTGSGTEGNNLAIKGLFDRHHAQPGHFITTMVEHPSVLRVGQHLESLGHDVTWLPVRPDGTLSVDSVRKAMRDNTIAVAVMAANNEIGTTFPLAEIGEICRQSGVAFIVDAVQAFGKIPIHPKKLGISVLTLSGHKLGAPKGIGAIFVDNSMELASQVHGGGQESGLRPGTENVIGIHALGLAATLASAEMEAQQIHSLALRNQFLEQLDRTVPDAIVNGNLEHRMPNNLSVGFPGFDSGSLLLSLNQIGIYVSAGSACSAGNDSYSHVLQAIGVDPAEYGTIRFSFGTTTSAEDIDYLFEHLPVVLDGFRH